MNPSLTNSAGVATPVAAPSVLTGNAVVINVHEVNALTIVHIVSVLLLVGATFYACAGAPNTRKKTLMWGGIASLLVVITGVRLWQVLFQFEYKWPFVKLVCWLGISAHADDGAGDRRGGDGGAQTLLNPAR
jgi:hypothetical protein